MSLGPENRVGVIIRASRLEKPPKTMLFSKNICFYNESGSTFQKNKVFTIKHAPSLNMAGWLAWLAWPAGLAGWLAELAGLSLPSSSEVLPNMIGSESLIFVNIIFKKRGEFDSHNFMILWAELAELIQHFFFFFLH